MKGFEIMKKSVKRIAATAAAVMMMLSGSAIGASAASPYTLKKLFREWK